MALTSSGAAQHGHCVSYTEPAFQRTKERRSLKGKVAALVRHGAASALANTDAVPQMPKTFGIPLHTCVMSSLHQVKCRCI